MPGGGTSAIDTCSIIDRDRWLFYEVFATRWNASAGRWEGGSGAIFNLATNDRRPDTWTSADAAGLAILPGLVRYDEVFGAGEITHAFRFSTRGTNGYVWPASHRAGSNASAPPMGTRMRMKASRDISGYPAEIQKIFRAMKRYGLILADNGSDMYITGTMDARWNNDVLNPAFHSLTADDFEVVELGWGRGDTARAADRSEDRAVARGLRGAWLRLSCLFRSAFINARGAPPPLALARRRRAALGPQALSIDRDHWANRSRPRIALVADPFQKQSSSGCGQCRGRDGSLAPIARASSNCAASAGFISPRPTAASTPTMRRTIFQRKCDPCTRMRTSAPASTSSRRSSTTTVDFSSGSSSEKAAKSCRPTNASAARRMASRSSGSRIHQTKGLANAVRRREI